MHPIAKTGLIVAAAYGVVTAALFMLQRGMLYFPSGTNTPPPGFRMAKTQTADGLALRHWYRAPAGPGGGVLLVFHGNGGNAAERGPKMLPLVPDGMGLLLAEYRGYGGNPGRPSQSGLTADGRSVLDWLESQGVGRERVILYGESLGSGVAVQLAAKTPVAGLVLEAPYSSIADVAQHHYWYLAARWLVRDRWDSAAVIGKVRAPLLVLHGERDTVIPIRFARKLFAAAAEPKAFIAIPPAGHNDVLVYAQAAAGVQAFLTRHGTKR